MLQFVLWYVIKIVAKLALLAFLGWLYKELTMGICKCQRSIETKVVVITGENKYNSIFLHPNFDKKS